MINEKMYGLGDEPSAIRELFAYGLARKAEIGAENVFDFSIGNPSVPAPALVRDTLLELLEGDPVALHAYSPAAGLPEVRAAVAASIAERYGVPATAAHVYLTAGAAAALAASIAAVTEPGDEVVVIAPYFPEYRTWIEAAGCVIVEVPAAQPSFQPDIEALAAAIGPRTSAVIINTPNNPVGAVYTRESLEALADLLREKEAELDRPLYLMSEQPYRDIAYPSCEPWEPTVYESTIVCYSYSKSLSLPGERIGWVYVSDSAPDGDEVAVAVAGAGRALGYVCAPVMLQRVAARCVNEPSDVAAYAENRRLLTEGLAALGYEYVEPDGAFYLWVRALEEDAAAFSERAKQFELLIVPSDSFGVGGWVRLSYCIARDVIERSMTAFAALKASYEG